MSSNTFARLEAWFQRHCDGEWENGHGISIETCDNPGWWVKIDLNETELETKYFEPIYRGNANSLGPGFSWLRCYTEEGIFHGAGDVATLQEILVVFLDWSEMTA